jgi:hypothetical protein
MSDKALEIQFKDAKHPSEAPHLRTGFCGQCFRERVFMLNGEYSKAMCRYCGTVYIVKNQKG